MEKRYSISVTNLQFLIDVLKNSQTNLTFNQLSEKLIKIEEDVKEIKDIDKKEE